MAISSFRDVRVWHAGVDLAEHIYAVSRTFPRHETYGLASRMQRAAVSVPSNIAEGHTREYSKEYVQHLAIARASLAELETHLEIAARLHYLSQEQHGDVLSQISTLGRQRMTLRDALTKKAETSP